MEELFSAVIMVCEKLQVVSDLFWGFPTNLDWYASIPVLGNFSLAIIVLVGTSLFFTFRFGFVQFRHFGRGIRTLMQNTSKESGISPLASFLLSSAMRVGPGNILGVTGAITVGGPGAVFWMWISALLAMATAFVESTLSQIFKEKDGKEYLGGMAYYGRRLCKGAVWVGVALSSLYIIYAFLCLPAQGFNTISGINMVGSSIVGYMIPDDSIFNYIAFGALIVFVAYLSFGGIRRVSKFTDGAVPVMAVIYFVTTLVLILINANLIPWFFQVVFVEAFQPNAIFGGLFGVALQQGIKRGLMSNEAGQGTISMAAAASNAKHPCEQGNVQSLGVFFDTIVICTPTAFVVIMAQLWLGEGGQEWLALDKLPKFITSTQALVGYADIPSMIVTIIVSVCFALFALTTLVGFLSFSEICAKRITSSKGFVYAIKIISLFVITFGVLANFAGLDLSALWNLSDLANIMMVYFNIPLLYVGLHFVLKAYKQYNANLVTFDAMGLKADAEFKINRLEEKIKNSKSNNKMESKLQRQKEILETANNQLKDCDTDKCRFTSEVAGISLPVWDSYYE